MSQKAGPLLNRAQCVYSKGDGTACYQCGLSVLRSKRANCPFLTAINALEMASNTLKTVEWEVSIDAAAECDQVISRYRKGGEK